MATIPSDRADVIRTISLVVQAGSTSGQGFELVGILPNGTCSGAGIHSMPTRAALDHSVALEPGFAIAPSGQVSFRKYTATGVVGAYLWGYYVPKEDAPFTTPVS